jgi:hypothetical protein
MRLDPKVLVLFGIGGTLSAGCVGVLGDFSTGPADGGVDASEDASKRPDAGRHDDAGPLDDAAKDARKDGKSADVDDDTTSMEASLDDGQADDASDDTTEPDDANPGCGQGSHLCGTSCVSNDSTSSCGKTACAACVPPTNSVATCNGTSCGFTCDANLHDCSGACVSNALTSSCGATSCAPCPVPANSTATCDGTNCGFTCVAPATLCGSECCLAVEYGYFNLTTGGTADSFTVGYLNGQPISVGAAMTVTTLGVNAITAGPSVVLALYGSTDASGATPGTILAATASTPLVVGANKVPVVVPVSIAAGTYWVMAEYSQTATIAIDSATTNQFDSVVLAYGAPLPSPFDPTGFLPMRDHAALYIVGTSP